MRYGIYGLVLGILLGLALGFGLSYFWYSAGKSATLVAVVNETDELRSELTKNRNIKLVESRLIREALELRKKEPEMTRNRKSCQEFGAKILVEREFKKLGDDKYTTTITIVDVDSGALLWTKTWDQLVRSGYNDAVATVVAEEIKRHLP